MSKPQSILALDMGSSNLKLAEFVIGRDGQLELVQFDIEPLAFDPLDEADRSAYYRVALKSLLERTNAKQGAILLCVPGISVFSRFVKLPSVGSDKIRQMVQYEAQQNVPFPMDDVVWDYQLLTRHSDDGIHVLLAAVMLEMVERYDQQLEAAGYATDLVDVAPMALYNTVRYNYPSLPRCSLVIDMGARSTDLLFLEGENVFARSVPVAGNAITEQIMREFDLGFEEAEELKKTHAYISFGEDSEDRVVENVAKSARMVMTRLHAEINRSITFYRSQRGGGLPEVVYLSGGSSVIPYTDLFLKEKLEVDVEFVNPFEQVSVSRSIATEEIQRVSHQMGEVVGLALRKAQVCPIEIDLLPPSARSRKFFLAKQPAFLASAICLLLLLLTWCLYFYRLDRVAQKEMYFLQEKVDRLDQVEHRLKSAEARERDLQIRIEQLLDIKAHRSAWLRVLNQIHGCVPPGLWLTSIHPLRNKREDEKEAAQERIQSQAKRMQVVPAIVELNGLGYTDKVPTSDLVIRFRDNLRANALFSESTEIQRSPSTGPGDTVREFSLYAVLNEPTVL